MTAIIAASVMRVFFFDFHDIFHENIKKQSSALPSYYHDVFA
jgi:hypothetical protein